MSVQQIADGTYLIVDGTVWQDASTCVYLVLGERGAIVETGPAKCAADVLNGLAAAGVAPEQISYIVPTHIHIDHGGGAGLLARQLTGAKVVVCRQGARHIVDPGRLIAGTKAYFGEDYADRFGPLLPVDPDRMLAVCEGYSLDLGAGHSLRVMHTSGHAPHHHSLYDSGTGVLFPGEAAGIHLADPGITVPCTGGGSFDYAATLADQARFAALGAHIVAYSHWGVGHDAARSLRESAQRTVAWGDTLLATLRPADGRSRNPDQDMGRGTQLFLDLALVALAERGAAPELVARLRPGLQMVIPDLALRGYLDHFRRQGLL